MKASDRIEEIMKKLIASAPFGIVYNNPIAGIIQYLDEEKARVNEVLHEIVGAVHDGAFDTQNCNYLHQMIEEKLVD